MNGKTIVSCVVLGGMGIAHAADEQPQAKTEHVQTESEKKAWSDEAELSLVNTSGNSDVSTFSAKNTFQYAFSERFTVSWKLFALRSETSGVLSAEHYTTDARIDYGLTQRSYLFTNAGAVINRFAGIDLSRYIGVGIGYKLLSGPQHKLLGETGVRYVAERFTNGTDVDHLDGRLFAEYTYKFAEKNKFTFNLEYLHDFDDSRNYRVNSEVALIQSLNQVFSTKLSYRVSHDNQPIPSTLNKTDAQSSVALIANF